MVKVSIVKSEKPDVKKALDLIDFAPKECELLVIKPNFCIPRPSSIRATTDLRVLTQVLKLFENIAKERAVVESDGYYATAEEAFEITGARELCEYYGAKLVNLSKDMCIPVKRDYNALVDFKVPRTILKADFLVNMPVMKTHELTTVSLSLKNMLGIIHGKKMLYHPRVEEAICDVMKVRKPDLNILDATTALAFGRPKKMDLVMASCDAVALDAVACKVMGINPDAVEHIVRAGYYNFGTALLKKIQVVGEQIENVREKFIF